MKNLFEKTYKNFLVIDIETASAYERYEDMDERLQSLWNKKSVHMPGADDYPPDQLYFEKAGIYAEFGKVICISAGVFTMDENHKPGLRIKSFASESEQEILENFKTLIESKFEAKNLRMVAHNGREFDFPYLCRRMLVHGMAIPEALDLRDKKPWEICHIDTLEMWKFGDRKNFTSLDLLASLFGISSSKDDIDGSQVNKVYYKEKNLERISQYCQKDVMVTAQVFLKLNAMQPIDINNISYL